MTEASAGASTRFAAFLRGINVGGRHRLPMADVKDVVAGLGATEIATYIQSGNIVFTAAEAPSRVEASNGVEAQAWAEALSDALSARAGFPVPATVLTADELVEARQGCPFAPEDPRWCHLVLLREPVTDDDGDGLRELCAGTTTELGFAGRTAYLFTPGGLSMSKPADRILGRLAGTARNLRTVDAVIDRL